MISRSREASSLIRKVAPTQPTPRDPAVEEEASRAVEQWGLLALLTHGLHSPARPVSLRAELIQTAPLSSQQRQAGPLDQIFARLNRAPVATPASVATPQPAATAPPTQQSANADAAMTIEPRDVLHYSTDASPTRLFERIKR